MHVAMGILIINYYSHVDVAILAEVVNYFRHIAIIIKLSYTILGSIRKIPMDCRKFNMTHDIKFLGE